MARGDPEFAKIETEFILMDPRWKMLTGAAAKTYITLWGLAVKLRTELLPPRYETVFVASFSGQDTRTCQRSIDKLHKLELITVDPKSGIFVHGVQEKHQSLRGWKSISSSPNKTNEVGEREGEERERESNSEDKPTSIIKLWNEAADSLPIKKVGRASSKLRNQISTRLKEKNFDLQAILSEVVKSKFLKGEVTPKNGHKQFVLTLGWITKNDDNYCKILNGDYQDPDNKRQSSNFLGML